LQSSWQSVQPVLRELQSKFGPSSALASVRFTLSDWQWASSTFLARSVGLPVAGKLPDAVISSLVPGPAIPSHACHRNAVVQKQDDTVLVQDCIFLSNFLRQKGEHSWHFLASNGVVFEQALHSDWLLSACLSVLTKGREEVHFEE
jgi:hypothetical protein